jgi:hypothetical protein
MLITSEAFREELRYSGGGNAVGRNTDNDGQDSSVKASQAVPNSQL